VGGKKRRRAGPGTKYSLRLRKGQGNWGGNIGVEKKKRNPSGLVKRKSGKKNLRRDKHSSEKEGEGRTDLPS